MISKSWFFIMAGLVAIISSIVDRTTPFVNDVEGHVAEDEVKPSKPTRRDRLVFGVVGIASLIYGIYSLVR